MVIHLSWGWLCSRPTPSDPTRLLHFFFCSPVPRFFKFGGLLKSADTGRNNCCLSTKWPTVGASVKSETFYADHTKSREREREGPTAKLFPDFPLASATVASLKIYFNFSSDSSKSHLSPTYQVPPIKSHISPTYQVPHIKSKLNFFQFFI